VRGSECRHEDKAEGGKSRHTRTPAHISLYLAMMTQQSIYISNVYTQATHTRQQRIYAYTPATHTHKQRIHTSKRNHASSAYPPAPPTRQHRMPTSNACTLATHTHQQHIHTNKYLDVHVQRCWIHLQMHAIHTCKYLVLPGDDD